MGHQNVNIPNILNETVKGPLQVSDRQMGQNPTPHPHPQRHCSIMFGAQ